jgi:putative transposase
MARKLRLEFPGACYHVINRGNYRADIFATDGAKAAFERCLFEAGTKSGWLLHAFVLMRNHYHLAVETPLANLVSGMQWLQATFANRFNRFRDERGHLFQGRYKALLVEKGTRWGWSRITSTSTRCAQESCRWSAHQTPPPEFKILMEKWTT